MHAALHVNPLCVVPMQIESEHLVAMALQEAPERAFMLDCQAIYAQMESEGTQSERAPSGRKSKSSARAPASGRSRQAQQKA